MRNLGEFLFRGKYSQYLRALDFSDAGSRPTPEPDAIKKAMRTANERISHITRKALEVPEEIPLNVTEILIELDEALQNFSAATSSKFKFERYERPSL